MNELKKFLGKSTKRSGRANSGKISVYHRGGGVNKRYRKITFCRNINNELKGVVVGFFYDPNRNVPLALVYYQNGLKELILKPKGLKIGHLIYCTDFFINKSGCSTFISKIPVGTQIHNLETKPFSSNTLIRSGNTFGTILGYSNNYIMIKLPSKQIKLFNKKCKATLGCLDINNKSKKLKKKAGINRLLGIRPTVRGSAMNPCDHPHGGGEGKSPIGQKFPKTPWGKCTLGKKTKIKKK